MPICFIRYGAPPDSQGLRRQNSGSYLPQSCSFLLLVPFLFPSCSLLVASRGFRWLLDCGLLGCWTVACWAAAGALGLLLPLLGCCCCGGDGGDDADM